MPPQRYSMSGPFLALAAAAKLGIRLSVDCSAVSIVMFGWAASYFCTESATKFFMPPASWTPHHHIVSLTGPLDYAGVLAEPLESPLELPQPAAIATTAASRSNMAVLLFTIAILLRFRDPLKKSLSARRRRRLGHRSYRCCPGRRETRPRRRSPTARPPAAPAAARSRRSCP